MLTWNEETRNKDILVKFVLQLFIHYKYVWKNVVTPKYSYGKIIELLSVGKCLINNILPANGIHQIRRNKEEKVYECVDI